MGRVDWFTCSESPRGVTTEPGNLHLAAFQTFSGALSVQAPRAVEYYERCNALPQGVRNGNRRLNENVGRDMQTKQDKSCCEHVEALILFAESERHAFGSYLAMRINLGRGDPGSILHSTLVLLFFHGEAFSEE